MKVAITTENGVPITPDFQLMNLNEVLKLESGICDIIDMGNSLEFTNKPDQALIGCITKLKIGGKLRIIGYDAIEMCRAFFLGMIDKNTFCSGIYNGRVTIHSAIEIKNKLQELGLKIYNFTIDNNQYHIETVRES